jgi:hypothetical protein
VLKDPLVAHFDGPLGELFGALSGNSTVDPAVAVVVKRGQ